MLGVTSFSSSGYRLYGKSCLESLKHWPCKFVVFYEEKPDYEHLRIEYRDLFGIPGINDFLDRIDGTDASGKINDKYDYRFDAFKFSRKVFCMEAVFDEDPEVFWLDADTLTKKDIPIDFLRGLVKDYPFCYIGRDRFRTETGFLGFNTSHKDFPLFRGRYLSTYTSGKFFDLQAWEDTAVFDYARGRIGGNNLNKTALQGIDHPFPHTILGEYIEHYKGGRKFVLGDGQRQHNPERPRVGGSV